MRIEMTESAQDMRCKIALLIGQTDPDTAPHRRQSMILVSTPSWNSRNILPRSLSAHDPPV